MKSPSKKRCAERGWRGQGNPRRILRHDCEQETLRTALALGADRAILVETDVELQPLAVAKLLKAVVQKESPNFAISRQAGDRRRLQPDRANAGCAVGLVPGHVRLEGEDCGWQGRSHA